jgi:hypothetical protein
MPAVAERLRETRLAERDADVLDRVVLVDVEVARGVQRQVEAAVPREQLEHVVEEADAGADVVAALAVEASASGSASRSSAGRSPRGAQHLLHRGEARPRCVRRRRS